MKKIKITKEQYDKLFENFNKIPEEDIDESKDVNHGINRVNKRFKTEFSGSNIKQFEGENFNIKDPISGIPNSKMRNKKELREDIKSTVEILNKFVEAVYNNASQKGLSTFFQRNGISWGDIAAYLTSVGIIGVSLNGVYRVTNILKKRYNSKEEKLADLPKIADKATEIIKQNPEELLAIQDKRKNHKPNDYLSKLAAQKKPDSDWKAEPKTFNPNQFRMGGKMQEIETNIDDDKNITNSYKPIYANKEIAILNGPDGMYVFNHDNIDIEELNIENISNYVNKNIEKISKGEGIKDWDNDKIDLVKIDEKLKEELRQLYEKNKELIKTLNKLEEMTSTASVGAGFTGPLGAASRPNISPDYTPSKQIETINSEDENYGKSIEETDSSSSGQYTGVKFLAKNKNNWAAAHKTQYPNGEMVHFNPCTKLNNNKVAQGGGCSQGSIDNVVTTNKTKNSVISKNSVYETIAKKTGKSISEIKKIITRKK